MRKKINLLKLFIVTGMALSISFNSINLNLLKPVEALAAEKVVQTVQKQPSTLKELEKKIKTLKTFKENSQIVWITPKEFTVYLYGGYKKGMDWRTSLKLPAVTISFNDVQNSFCINFYEKYSKKEKAFLKELLKVYYPNSYKKAYENVLNVKPKKAITKTYDGRHFQTAKVGKELFPVVDIGRAKK